MLDWRAHRPVDLAAVQADDAMLDLLGADFTVPEGDELSRVLAGWRRELGLQEIPELLDLDTALAVISGARARRT